MPPESTPPEDQGSHQEMLAAKDYSVPTKLPAKEKSFPFAAFFRRAPKIGVTEAIAGQVGHEKMVEGILRRLFRLG